MTDDKSMYDMAQIIWTAEQDATGHFNAVLGRKQAAALVKEGYAINGNQSGDTERDLFTLLIKTEDEVTGIFHAHVARAAAKALVDRGVSRS